MQKACEVGVQLQSTEVLFPLTTVLYLSHISDAVTGLEGRVPSSPPPLQFPPSLLGRVEGEARKSQQLSRDEAA